jgi:hypothetical protein
MPSRTRAASSQPTSSPVAIQVPTAALGGHGRGEGLDFRRAAFGDLHYWFCRPASATI